MTANWARELRKGLVSGEQLATQGLLEPDVAACLPELQQNFDIRVPASALAGLREGTPPLARQFVPDARELLFLPEELEDPIGDERWTPVEGVTHRYPDRALLKLTYQCASYCRFCFRRYKVSDPAQNPDADRLDAALRYLENETGIREVILTGGDPLVLTDARLRPLLERIARIPHVRFVRFHTRIPTVLPSRVTPELVTLLRSLGKTVWIVAHINTAAELTPEARLSLARLVDGGIPVLSQSVLLKGVNDTHEALRELLETLVEFRVKPYYLHYPDLARGTQHFRVPLSRAMNLMRGLRGKISGLCLPQLVVDIPGGHGKIIVESEWARPCVSEQERGEIWEFRSPLSDEWVRVEYPLATS